MRSLTGESGLDLKHEGHEEHEVRSFLRSAHCLLNRNQEENGQSYEGLKGVLDQAAEEVMKELAGGKPSR